MIRNFPREKSLPECESVVHVPWECPCMTPFEITFIGELDNLVWGSFEKFNALNNFMRTGFV